MSKYLERFAVAEFRGIDEVVGCIGYCGDIDWQNQAEWVELRIDEKARHKRNPESRAGARDQHGVQLVSDTLHRPVVFDTLLGKPGGPSIGTRCRVQQRIVQQIGSMPDGLLQ